MRDNGMPYTQGHCGLETYVGLAQEALKFLVSARSPDGVEVSQEHLDHFLNMLDQDHGFDPLAVLDDMASRRLDPAAVAFSYVPEAARALGERWLADQISFVTVTVGTERLHDVLRRVDEILDVTPTTTGPSALILVAEAEQHTLGAYVVALELRAAGFSVTVRVAPVASELTQLMGANRFDVALVSMGCTAALDSGTGLVRTLRLLSRGHMKIFVGGSISITDERLLSATSADSVLRDVSALVAEYEGCNQGQPLDRGGRNGIRTRRAAVAKGDGVES